MLNKYFFKMNPPKTKKPIEIALKWASHKDYKN